MMGEPGYGPRPAEPGAYRADCLRDIGIKANDNRSHIYTYRPGRDKLIRNKAGGRAVRRHRTKCRRNVRRTRAAIAATMAPALTAPLTPCATGVTLGAEPSTGDGSILNCGLGGPPENGQGSRVMRSLTGAGYQLKSGAHQRQVNDVGFVSGGWRSVLPAVRVPTAARYLYGADNLLSW
jgi:hypothetical protein